MGHSIRYAIQKKSIAEIIDFMKAFCERKTRSEDGLIILYYKIKFEALYFREKTVDNFGNSAISCIML